LGEHVSVKRRGKREIGGLDGKENQVERVVEKSKKKNEARRESCRN